MENTGIIISLVLLGRGWEGWGGRRGRRNSSGGVDRVKGGGRRAPPRSASRAENTIMTECKQESGHRQSIYALVWGQHTYYSDLLMSKRIEEVRRTGFLYSPVSMSKGDWFMQIFFWTILLQSHARSVNLPSQKIPPPPRQLRLADSLTQSQILIIWEFLKDDYS